MFSLADIFCSSFSVSCSLWISGGETSDAGRCTEARWIPTGEPASSFFAGSSFPYTGLSSWICSGTVFLRKPVSKGSGAKIRSRFFLLFFSLFPFLFLAFQFYLWDHLSAGESLCDHIIGGIVHSPLILEPDFHLVGWTFTSISSPEIVYWRQTKGYLCCII